MQITGWAVVKGMVGLGGALALADMRFTETEQAHVYVAGADDYPGICKTAPLEMHRQVGLHKRDEYAIAFRGTIIRKQRWPNRCRHR